MLIPTPKEIHGLKLYLHLSNLFFGSKSYPIVKATCSFFNLVNSYINVIATFGPTLAAPELSLLLVLSTLRLDAPKYKRALSVLDSESLGFKKYSAPVAVPKEKFASHTQFCGLNLKGSAIS